MIDNSPIPAPLANDLIRGVPKIAEFLGESKRRVNYLLETRRLPAGKEGNSWIASKTTLRAHYAKLTGAEAA